MGSKRKEKMSTAGQVDHGSLSSQSICYDSDSSNSHHYYPKKKKNKNQNSNPLLLEDLRFYIFIFVPVNSLLNSARYVCKSWAHTIATSHFAQRRHDAHSKLGIYVENHSTQDNSYFLGFQDYVNGQFERINLGIPQRMGRIVGTCHGMLLLRNISRESFFVNPILKCWLRLPNYPISRREIRSRYQINIARVPGTTDFKLFFADSLEVSGVYWYVLYVLRIGIDNSWKEIVRKEATLQQHYLCQIHYSGGNDLYWITKGVLFVIDVVKEIILRECPLPYVLNVLGQKYLLMGDRLSYITSINFSTFHIRILNLDTGKLFLHHEMGPFDFVAACGREVYATTILFILWINNHIIFKVNPHRNNVEMSWLANIHFSYNMKTRQLTKIEDIDEGNFDVWLHTNSLISLPNTPI